MWVAAIAPPMLNKTRFAGQPPELTGSLKSTRFSGRGQTCAHSFPSSTCAPMPPLVSEVEAIRDFILAFGRRLPGASDRLMVSADILETPILKRVVPPLKNNAPRLEQLYHIAWVDKPSSKFKTTPVLQLDIEERPLLPPGNSAWRDQLKRTRLLLSPEGDLQAVYEGKGLSALGRRENLPEDRERVRDVQHAIDTYYDKNWESMVTPVFPVYRPTPSPR